MSRENASRARRHFADVLNVTAADAAAIVQINDETRVKWLYSFLSADKRKTYCLYQPESGSAIREAARRAVCRLLSSSNFPGSCGPSC